MSEQEPRFSIEFPDYYDDFAKFDHSAKGFLGDVVVRFRDGTRYKIYFIDNVRLQQDFEEERKLGNDFFAEPNMVIVDQVTPEVMRDAVEGLVRQGFFDKLGPMTDPA